MIALKETGSRKVSLTAWAEISLDSLVEEIADQVREGDIMEHEVIDFVMLIDEYLGDSVFTTDLIDALTVSLKPIQS